MTPLVSHKCLLPPLAERLAAGRPVVTREQAQALMQKIVSLSTIDHAEVMLEHTVRSVTRVANGRVRSTDDGDTVQIFFRNTLGQSSRIQVLTNQLDEETLRLIVAQADALAHDISESTEKVMVEKWDEQDTYQPNMLWHDTTVQALTSARETALPPLLEAIHKRQFRASGFIGVMARAGAVLAAKGSTAFYEATDCEVTATARPADGSSSGWAGTAARDWATIDPGHIAAEAVDIAERNVKPSALEPGRRTAILGPAAVIQLMRFLVPHFAGMQTDLGDTGFSKVHGQRKGNKLGQRMFDPRVKITSDPSDPDGGFPNWFDRGYRNNPMTWVDQGILKTLGYGVASIDQGKPYADLPHSLRFHGEDTSVEQMIAQCDEGIYVNRFSSVDVLDMWSGMMTGVTRDGCFFVKKGKINRPVKNFRFMTSPFFFLNNLIAMGSPRRAAFGYAPWTQREVGDIHYGEFFEWPRLPMIVPPMMVRDFNFNALIDAV